MAMRCVVFSSLLSRARGKKRWQGREDLNPRPAVLELSADRTQRLNQPQSRPPATHNLATGSLIWASARRLWVSVGVMIFVVGS